MNTATAEKLMEHHVKCGSHEYQHIHKKVNGKTVLIYKCKKCNAQIRPVNDE